MDLDPSKKCMYIEDNGDGTCTMTINIPEIQRMETAVIQFTFDQIIGEVGNQMPDDVQSEIRTRTTILPDMP